MSDDRNIEGQPGTSGTTPSTTTGMQVGRDVKTGGPIIVNSGSGNQNVKYTVYQAEKQRPAKHGPSFRHNIEAPTDLYQGNYNKFQKVHNILETHKGSPHWQRKIVAVTGMGGIGKTEFARQYAFKYYKSSYQYIVWINAETEGDARKSFESIAEELKCSKKDIKNAALSELAGKVYKKLQTYAVGNSSQEGPPTAALFIFDNANQMVTGGRDPQDKKGIKLDGVDDSTFGIRDLFPSKVHDDIDIFVLITTQWEHWGEHGVSIVPMEMLSQEDTLAYFKKYFELANDKDYGNVEPLLKQLTELLQGYPLAITLAAANIGHNRKTIETLERKLRDYVESFDDTILTQRFNAFVQHDYRTTLETVWNKSIARLASEDGGDSALQVLKLAAVWPNQQVRLDELSETFSVGFPEIDSNRRAEEQKREFDDAVQLLHKFSLITVHDLRLSMHRLVRAFIVTNHSRNDPIQLTKLLRWYVYTSYVSEYLYQPQFENLMKNVAVHCQSEEVCVSLLLISLWERSYDDAMKKLLQQKDEEFWKACRSSEVLQAVMTTWRWFLRSNYRLNRIIIVRQFLVSKFFDLPNAAEIPAALTSLQNCTEDCDREIFISQMNDSFRKTTAPGMINDEMHGVLSSMTDNPPSNSDYSNTMCWLNLLKVVNLGCRDIWNQGLKLRIFKCLTVFCKSWDWEAIRHFSPLGDVCSAIEACLEACNVVEDAGAAPDRETKEQLAKRANVLALDLATEMIKSLKAARHKPQMLFKDFREWENLTFYLVRYDSNEEFCSKVFNEVLPEVLDALINSPSDYIFKLWHVGMVTMQMLVFQCEWKDWTSGTTTIKKLLGAGVSAFLRHKSLTPSRFYGTNARPLHIAMCGWFLLFKSVNCGALTVTEAFSGLDDDLWDLYKEQFDINCWDGEEVESVGFSDDTFGAAHRIASDFLKKTQTQSRCEVTVKARTMAQYAVDLTSPKNREKKVRSWRR